MLNISYASDKPCMLSKGEHRLHDKRDNRADAQDEKSTFTGYCHVCFPYLTAAALSTTASVADQSY